MGVLATAIIMFTLYPIILLLLKVLGLTNIFEQKEKQ